MKARMKVEAMGPEATPPESKAMAVNMRGQKHMSSSAAPYPGMRKNQRLVPESTRYMAMATASETPAERAASMSLRRMAPPETCSTCSVRIQTAGSAHTTTAPSTSATGMSQKRCSGFESRAPSVSPAGMKPPFTPRKNRMTPKKV